MSHILLQQVLDFHKKFNCPIGDPRDPDVDKDIQFRYDLIAEEYGELVKALFTEASKLTPQERIVAVADALGDIVYTCFGAAVTWGIDLASVLDAIHDSNMTKEGGGKRDDGKVLKGPDYQEPKIQEVLEDVANAYSLDLEKGVDQEDLWWPMPECPNQDICDGFHAEDCQQKTTDKIMASAKEQAQLLARKNRANKAMKSIKQDFVPDTKSNGSTIDNRAYTIKEKELGPVWNVPEGQESPKCVSGYMTSYGVYILTCTCNRQHCLQAKLGSRGGLTNKAKAECMCGAAYIVDFSNLDRPEVQTTTIEELRKET